MIDIVNFECGKWTGLSKTIEKEIKALPSAQPEIIHCKDCKYNGECAIQYTAQAGDKFFCGAGERRQDG